MRDNYINNNNLNSSQRTMPQSSENNSENERRNTSRCTKEQKINIILILIGILCILVICCYIIYYISALKDSESTLYLSNDPIDSSVASTKVDNRCAKFLDNCQRCDGVDAIISCLSCKEGYYPEYDENNNIIYCLEKCHTGNSQFCKSCDSTYPNECGSCNSGYFLPINDLEKTQCTKCPDHCSHCTGKKESIVCDTCEKNYILSKSTNECLESCKIGKDSLCQTCDEDNPSICGTCNIGYYLPSDGSKTECKKCSDLVPFSNRGLGTSDSMISISCMDNYFLSLEGKCIENACQIGNYYGCKECDMTNNKCSSCNIGYYLPTDDNVKSQCKKCSDVVNNCIECSGKISNIECTKCEDNYLLSGNKCIKCKTGIYDACKTCDSSNPNFCGSCNQGYYLPLNEQNKEKCKKCSDSISNCEECEYDDVNDKVVCTSCKLNYYVTSSKECDLACTIKSGKYCKTCNTPNLNQCKTCNYGYYLPSDDTEKSNCKKCTDLSNNCNECSGTLTSVVCKSCTNNYFLSSGICYKKCDIGENEYCQSCNSANQTQCETCNNGYYLPIDDSDKTKCKACNNVISNCNKCSGTKTSITCTGCENNLILYNNKCYTKCQIGKNEYCKSCNPELQHQCYTCNDGFYLPKDDTDKTRCKRCSEAKTNCNKCYETDSGLICTECINNYYISENECIKKCTTGSYSSCKTCNPDNPKQCGSCNEGYYLATDDEYKINCYSCLRIQLCKKCYGKTDYPTCTECDPRYFLNEKKNWCQYRCRVNSFYCRECNYETNECTICMDGFYVPFDADEKFMCKYCPYGCAKCYDSGKQIICTACNNGYIPGYNDKNEIVSCNNKCVPGSVYCKTCNQVTNECTSCPDGYYVPTDALSKNKCISCYDTSRKQNCKVCQGTSEKVECIECREGYVLYGDKISCPSSRCSAGVAECKKCYSDKNQCEICNKGYYMPSDDNLKLICKKCSDIDRNCQECEGSFSSINCTECKEGYHISSNGLCEL